jgi:eukaryotic-like serine/threonine-protein kinase
MSPEQQQQQRQQQIEEVFQTAVLMEDEQQREEFLDQACAGDETIRGEVEKLLTGGVGVVEPVKRSGEDRELDRMIGRKVGVYKIEREIGRGGMGAVYLARRADGVFEQKVAVKLIKRGMDTDLVVRRFRNERQILATLSHPNITRLLDGGTTRDGLPFFVMEYVAGEQLYAFCDKNKLTIAERLRIFRQICDAVEEAHRHKIIHRDLKPSNILVKADGTPKLLDFGIAKLLDPKIGATEMAEPTATHLRMMTPQYASPEQISGEAAAATPASDIYSLGVLLYELLTGHRPYRVKSRAPYEIARAVREEEPTRPSQILDKIVLKALRKNPAERYQSAADLSGDLTNFLENRPVKAEIFNSTESREADEKTAENSIAILPFKLLGSSSAAASGRDEDTGGAGDDYLRVGLADALISRLSGVRRLLVRPTSSILRFQDAADIFAAGRELRVAFVVEGTIRSAGERVRVSVRLLSVKNSSTVWSGNFDEPFTDVLEIEDLISARVAETLLPHLTSEEAERLHRRGTNSPAAYEAYLRGRHFANEFKEDSLPKAVEAYREAVRLDPHFALPHVGIADFYVLSTLIGVMPPREGYPLAKEELRLALEADERLAEAYSLLAFIALLYDWDWPKAERFVARALELNPNYHLAHDVRAHILASQGIADEAAGEIRLAESLDPLAPRAKLMTSCVLYQTRHFNEGARKAFEALEMEVNSAISLLHYGNSLTHGVSVEKAVEVLRQSARLWENSAIPRYMLCFALVAGGQTEEAREVLNEILKIAGTQSVKPYFVAMAYAALGETDAAFEWFEKSIEERDDWMLWFGTDIKLDALRRDPRYFEILRKTNNPIISRQLPAAAAAASS